MVQSSKVRKRRKTKLLDEEEKMRASMSKKTLIIGIFLFLLLFLASNASCEVEPVYAGWTVGDSWDDGSGTSYGTILRSTDSGETWIRQGEGQIADVGMQSVFAVDPYTAWVVGDSDSGYATIYHTTDGGSTWERKGSSNEASVDYVRDVNLCKVHAVGNDVWAVSKDAILHSSDGGATWTAWTPADDEHWGLQGVYTLDGKTVWVTGGTRILNDPDNLHGIILKTTDAGQTWTSPPLTVDFDDAPDFDAILAISAGDADTAWAVGGGDAVLIKTTDGGATWTRGPADFGGMTSDLNNVYAVNSSTVWVAGDDSIYRTTDGGQSWDSSEGLLPGGIAWMGISAVSDQKAWAAFGGYDYIDKVEFGYIASTTDGGTTWTNIEQINGEDLPPMSNISFATLPINLYDMIISLIEDVEQLVEDGVLNKGQGNALIKKLEKVLDRLIDDRNKSAVNALGAFSNQVDAFVRGGVLSPEDGQNLSDQVNDIIELLSFPL
jgi:photosystem II stability/assembly factor-like uncharacterized protein